MRFTFIKFFSVLTCSPLAFAEGGGISSQGGILGNMLLFGLIFAMFYFLMIRPQSKRQKEHRELIDRVTKGDEVVTSGGILGKISRVTDHFFMLAISEGVEIPVQKQSIATALPKGTIKSL